MATDAVPLQSVILSEAKNLWRFRSFPKRFARPASVKTPDLATFYADGPQAESDETPSPATYTDYPALPN
jgi:hypothetical protein